MWMLAMLAAVTGPQTFDLAPGGPPAPGSIAVAEGTPYQPGGHGYEPGGTGRERLFSVAVAEGNYRVTVRLGDARAASHTTVKAESRRLMLRNITTAPGQFVTASFVVNVRTAALAAPPANAPGGTAVRLKSREAGSFTWDDKLTLEFLGDPRVQRVTIEPVTVPTIFLAGDSTVTDQRAEPAASWGQMLPALFRADIAVANHAESGETLKSFVTELRLDKLLSQVKAGDWVLIQFGHNDQKSEWPQTYADPAVTYPAWLRTYIAEVRRRGGKPVLVTSPERRNFDAGRIRHTLAEYAEAMRKVAGEERVPLVDLQAATIALYEAYGPIEAAKLFNDGGRDKTHHNNPGAWLLAHAVAAGLADTVPELAAHLHPDARRFNPAHPPALDSLSLAPSLTASSERPAGS
ncbi:rhamnogalacturonan acetylesterase [Sphingomonas pituitosa]|uniref:rhamnogalacturonan acetylesterase n=1 Tax=Sphingomonas pituitosa TaxID=99597 RepID=UPI000AFD5CDF|nr:rhamnogalacturonan acetylesterase [Sphingomonas pituitosa]